MLRSGIVGSYANYIFSFENINVWVICIQEVFLEFRFLFIVLLLLTFPIWRSFSLIEKMVKFESLMFSPPPPPPLPLCSSPLPPPSSSSAHITPSGPSLRIVLILLFVPIHMLFFLICFLKGIFFFLLSLAFLFFLLFNSNFISFWASALLIQFLWRLITYLYSTLIANPSLILETSSFHLSTSKPSLFNSFGLF